MKAEPGDYQSESGGTRKLSNSSMVQKILAFGFSGQFRSRTAIEALADAGANRVTIWLDQTAGDAALAEMDQMARQVLV